VDPGLDPVPAGALAALLPQDVSVLTKSEFEESQRRNYCAAARRSVFIIHPGAGHGALCVAAA